MDTSILDNSILDDIKGMIGILADDINFDTDIIIYINNSFDILSQLGVSCVEQFRIVDKNDKWGDIEGLEPHQVDSLKTYIYIKVKLMFDPPLNSSILQSYKETMREMEWRLNIAHDENEEV